jgi:hypothetical protein
MVDDALSDLPVNLRVIRLPCRKTVHIAVEHAERGRNQYRVMNSLVRSAFPARSTSSAVTCFPPFRTAIPSRAFSFSETGAAPKSRLICSTRP